MAKIGPRDGWGTPRYIADRLPIVDMDPCSNRRSLIKARRMIGLDKHGNPKQVGSYERGNGLLVSWRGLSVFVNPPFSNVLPFAHKAIEARSYCYLVNIDVSTDWYRVLTQWPTFEFKFRKRIPFKAPPGIDASQNNHSQVLLCDESFYLTIKDSFNGLGQWWRKL